MYMAWAWGLGLLFDSKIADEFLADGGLVCPNDIITVVVLELLTPLQMLHLVLFPADQLAVCDRSKCPSQCSVTA